jgi:Putative auto-transporter adhesin, head GIN domain
MIYYSFSKRSQFVKLYYSLLTAVAILLGTAGSIYAAEQPLPSPQATRMPQKLAEFNVISVRGPIHLILQQTADSAENFFQIAENQNSPVNVSVREGALYLQAEGSGSATVATVGVSQLSHLIVDSGASVSSDQLTSSGLSIDASTSGDIQLRGMVKLDRILSSGSGLIDIQWVDSSRLRIEANHASKIQLAGIADSVEMRLSDESQFQGKYLRIDRIYVQTKDDSTAKLLVNGSLRAFAYDHSNIYYYKKPAELTEFTAGSGNILQLGWGK